MLLSRNQINKNKQANKVHLSDGKKRPRLEEVKVGVFRKDSRRYPEMGVGRCRGCVSHAGVREVDR